MSERISILGKTARAYTDGKRYIVNSGGSRSGKTFAVLTILNQIATKRSGLLISVVSETFPHLRKGAIRDFQELLMKSGGWDANAWNKSESTYSYPNESKIEFFSVDSPSKVHGPQRDILFINEGQNIAYDIVRHLLIRTSAAVFTDFNPTHEFWAHTEIQNDPDTAWIHSTYKDNPHLSKEQVKEIERNRKNANWWRVYGEGQIGQLEGLIFPEWKQIDTMPHNVQLTYGLDFGYTNDPTALVAVARDGDSWYIDELIYETGMRNSEIAARMKALGVDRYNPIFADSAEPKSIDDLAIMGWNIHPTVKGADSIMWGIDLIKQRNIKVTKRSVNLIKELRNYSYMKDKTGEKINRPMDAYNHGIDALRYNIMSQQHTKHQPRTAMEINTDRRL